MGRELRRVPITNTLASHPRRGTGFYSDGVTPNLQPMFDETFDAVMDEWNAERDLWRRREFHVKHPYSVASRTPEELYAETFEEYHGGPPDPAFYRPPHPEGVELGIQLWENTTEGTPQTEVYPDTEDGLRALCEEAAVKATVFGHERITAEEWFEALSSGLVTYRDPSIPGAVFL